MELTDHRGVIAHLSAGSASGVPGIDYAWSKPAVSAIKSAGDVFVAQYDSLDESKNLTPSRAHDLLAAKIKIVLVYEYRAQDMLRGHAGGVTDAQHAETAAKACGIDGIPIYFAADWDATPAQQAPINAYLDGAASVIGRARVGMYGGYWPTSRAKHAGKCTYVWGTVAWSGNEWATSGFVPDIMQGGFVTVGGVKCDLDAANRGDYGQWPRPSSDTASRTWKEWDTKGGTGLEDICRAVGQPAATVLRQTVQKWGPFDNVIYDYVNGLADGSVKPTDHIPAGGRLWVHAKS